jgi:hypothetical protein
MSKLCRALAYASLALSAACATHPQLINADPAPILMVAPARAQVVEGDIRRALAEYNWRILGDEPGHMVVELKREPFNLSVKMDIRYSAEQVVIKFLELVSLDGEPLDDIQIKNYHRWTGTLRQSIVDQLNAGYARVAAPAN